MSSHSWFYRRVKEGEIPPKDCLGLEHNGVSYIEDARMSKELSFGPIVARNFHGLFKPHSYDGVLTSEAECMEYLKKHNITDVKWDLLKEFWTLYPDGAIDFG